MPSKHLLEAVPLVYVDTCVYLDLIIKNEAELHKDTGEPRWQSAKSVFDAVKDGRIRLASSAMVEAEVCCNGHTRRRQGSSTAVRDLVQSWFTNTKTRWTDIDRYLAREAAQIAAEYSDKSETNGKKFHGADAVHVAAAVRLEADFLMTHDGGFPIGQKVRQTEIIRPRQVWQSSLFDA